MLALQHMIQTEYLCILYVHLYVVICSTPESLQNICGHSGSIQVAVKILSNLQVENMKTFYEEMEVMKQFTHSNIVSFLGMLLAFFTV